MLLSKIFTTLFQQILNSRLLNVVIDGKKIISMMGSIVNVVLLKKKILKKKSSTQKKYIYIYIYFITIFTIIELSNFYYQLGPPLTSLFYLPLSFYHINKCEKFC